MSVTNIVPGTDIGDVPSPSEALRRPRLRIAAWHWLRESVDDAQIAATKIDKLAHGERIRAMRELESVFEDAVLPVSAVTGEGLDELWKVIDRLANNNSSSLPRRRRNRQRPETARRRLKN